MNLSELHEETKEQYFLRTQLRKVKVEPNQARRSTQILLDDVYASQSCLQEEGDHHRSASLLLWIPAEETQQREGEDEDGENHADRCVYKKIREDK